ncbi:hypothetical protein I3843_03G185900 [Carya illinoinensis]|nr:hypothetical protein I3843_03G185900 [Carya illinoinensis]
MQHKLTHAKSKQTHSNKSAHMQNRKYSDSSHYSKRKETHLDISHAINHTCAAATTPRQQSTIRTTWTAPAEHVQQQKNLQHNRQSRWKKHLDSISRRSFGQTCNTHAEKLQQTAINMQKTWTKSSRRSSLRLAAVFLDFYLSFFLLAFGLAARAGDRFSGFSFGFTFGQQSNVEVGV